MQINDCVSISNEEVTSGIYRIVNISACGKKAYLVSDGRMIDKGWVDINILFKEITSQKGLDQIIHEVYGVGAVACDPLTVIWATDRIENTEFAKKELDRINRLRKKWGKMPAYIPFGHRLF